MIAYAAGFVLAPLSAWAGVRVGMWFGLAMMAAALLAACFFDTLVPIGSHGSVNYMAHWGLLIMLPWAVAGFVLSAVLCFMLAPAGAARQEQAELEAEQAAARRERGEG